MAIKIMVDAGHGGHDNGVTYKERREKDDTLKLALSLGEILLKKGFEVEYERTSDIYQNSSEKASIANSSGADYLISIHRNCSPTPNTYSGVETLLFNKGDKKENIANTINGELSKLGFQNLGIKVRTNISILRKTKMPALLIEVGFINTDIDNKLFDEKMNEIANAIATALDKSLLRINKVPFYYRIQLGLFRIYDNAVNMQKMLLEDDIEADIIQKGEYYAVITGQFLNIEQAEAKGAKLREKGYETLIIAL